MPCVLFCFVLLCAFPLALYIYLHPPDRVGFSQINSFIYPNQGGGDVLGLLISAIVLEWMIECAIPQILELFHAMMQRFEDGSNYPTLLF